MTSELKLKRQNILKINQDLTNQLIESERHFNAIELNKFGKNGGSRVSYSQALTNGGTNTYSQALTSMNTIYNQGLTNSGTSSYSQAFVNGSPRTYSRLIENGNAGSENLVICNEEAAMYSQAMHNGDIDLNEYSLWDLLGVASSVSVDRSSAQAANRP